MKRTSYILFSLLAFASCAKTPAPESEKDIAGNQILFSISESVKLKSSVESLEDLVYSSTNPAHVYLYATKDGSDFKEIDTNSTSTPKTYLYNYCSKELEYSASTGLWDIKLGSGESKKSWEYIDSISRPCEYVFSAFAFRGTDMDSSVVTKSSVSNFGRSFKLSQPDSANYAYNCGTDYLLSNSVSVTTTWNGSAARGEVVNLNMQHALASIAVKVTVNEDIYAVGIQGIQIYDFYRTATMTCTSQASYGSGKSNKWSTTLPENRWTTYLSGNVQRGDANTYKTIESCPFILRKSDSSHEKEIMKFIAIPQDPSNAVLTIAYLVQEESGGTLHQVVSQWQLNRYDSWQSGYRNVYTINIDTSNSLTCGIDDWVEGKTVNGVILP